VVKAVERWGDRMMVSVEKGVTGNSEGRRPTKRPIRIATADRKISIRATATRAGLHGWRSPTARGRYWMRWRRSR